MEPIELVLGRKTCPKVLESLVHNERTVPRHIRNLWVYFLIPITTDTGLSDYEMSSKTLNFKNSCLKEI